MPKLSSKSFKLKAEIDTPIHIWSGQVWDRMDYFVDKEKKEVLVLKREWLTYCSKKSPDLFKKIVISIEKGDFVSLEELKDKFFSSNFDENLVLENISVSEEALKHLTMEDKDYSSSNKSGIRGNLGEIKRFAFNKFGQIIIPGSTLKGLFRTMFLMSKKQNGDYIKQAKKLDNLDKNLKTVFSFIQFEDVIVKNPKIKIQNISLATESGNIPLLVETLTGGEIEIKITYDKNYFGDLDVARLLKDYSFEVVGREERILDNFDEIGKDLLDKLDEKYKENKYPVKIGMFKKSLTYKIFWEEELEDVYENLLKFINSIYKEVKSNFSIQNSESILKEVRGFILTKNLYAFYNKNALWKFGFENKGKIKGEKLFKKWIANLIKEKFNKDDNIYILEFEKPTKVVGQKLGIGDKSFYIDENSNPIGWVSLEIQDNRILQD